MTIMQRSSNSPQGFVIRLLAVGTGLVIFAYLLSSAFHVHLGLVLFLLGIVSMGAGNMLSLPARRYQRQRGTKHFNLFQLPAPEEYIADKLFIARNSTTFYSLENAVILGGIVILAIGLILLF